MKGKVWFKSVFVFSFILIMSVTVFADNMDDAKNKKDELEDRIKDTQIKIEELEQAKVDTLQYIQELDIEIEQLDTKIYTLEEQLVNKHAEINNTLANLEIAKENEDKQYELAKERMKFMYEYGDTLYLEMLLEAKDLTDLLSRMEYIEKIMDYDNNVLEDLVLIKEEIESQESQLELEKNELEHLTAELNLEKDTVEKVLVLKANEFDNYKENLEESKVALDEYEDGLEETENLIIKLEMESRLKYDGGKMAWPVPNYSRISSYFGNRTHPIFNTQKFHNGIDIPAPTGTDIVSAAAGKVVEAGWSNSYGNYIVIDHGSGYMTLYAHNSRLLVSVGDEVGKWQPISKAGSTGYSTGPHLHFSVRKSGEWINPLTMVDR
ncbi:MAG: murein hydrolase activator EnvC family protein [Eubacteriales bacterium]